MLTEQQHHELPGERGIAPCVEEIRQSIDGVALLARSACVDWLLDLRNAASRSSVKEAISAKIVTFSHGKLTETAHFIEALDEIELVLAADSVFDTFDLDAPSS